MGLQECVKEQEALCWFAQGVGGGVHRLNCTLAKNHLYVEVYIYKQDSVGVEVGKNNC